MEPSDDEDEQPEHLEGLDLRAAAAEFRDAPSRLWALLIPALHDEAKLNQLADMSSHHPNGFVKIVLLPYASPRVRLHVWPASARLPNPSPDPHGHRWAFASWIITGALTETTYIEGPRGLPFDVYGYAGADRSAPNLPLRSCLLAPQDAAHRKQGEIYSREPHELHIAEPAGDGLVASLVLQGPASDCTPVYRPSGSSQPRKNKPIPPDELRALLVEVTEILQPVA